MTKFLIVIEQSTTTLYSKVFEATSLDAAKNQAVCDKWPRFDQDGQEVGAKDWAVYDKYVTDEMREDQCRKLTPSRGRD